MNCPSCGKELPDSAKFCKYCGVKIEKSSGGEPKKRICTKCGRPIPEGYKFCTACGTPVPEKGGPEPAAPKTRICAKCGAQIPEGHKYCMACGTPVDAAPAGEPGNGQEKESGRKPESRDTDREKPEQAEGSRKKGISPVLLVILAFVAILAVIAAVFFLRTGGDDETGTAAAQDAAKEIEEVTAEDGEDEAQEDREETAEEEILAEDTEEDTSEEVSSEEETEGEEEGEEGEEEEDSGIDPEVEAAVTDILAQVEVIDAAVAEGDGETYLLEEDTYTVIAVDDEIVLINAAEETDSSGYARHYYYEDGEVLAAYYISDSAAQEYYFRDGALIRWISQEDVTLADGEVIYDLADTTEYQKQEKEVLSSAASVLEEMEEAIASQSEYILEGSDSRYIEESELEGLSEEELRLARNEIYARNGRKFNDETLTEYFSQFDWYEPTIDPDDFTDSMLNEYEIANLEVIVAYEEKMGYR